MVGIEVKAAELNRNPSTETFPEVVVNSARPFCPAVAANPVKPANVASVLAPAFNCRVVVPRAVPAAFQVAMVMLAVVVPGFAMATLVVRATPVVDEVVLSKIRVSAVELEFLNDTTAS